MIAQQESHRWEALLVYARSAAPELVPIFEEIRRRGPAVDFRPGGRSRPVKWGNFAPLRVG